MLQLSKIEEASRLVGAWNDTLFGGSSVRRTINPETLNTNSAMLRGVPVDAENFDILQDLTNSYPGLKMERLYKQGKVLRIIKLTFASKEQFENAFKNDGICLPSQHVKCSLERIHNG